MSVAANRHSRTCRCVRKRLLGTALVLIVCLPVSGMAAKYGGGNGTADAPFLIYTAEEFVMIGNNPGDWNAVFKLMRDIDLSGYDERNMSMIGRWVALGSLANQPFNGVFNGNRKTIANFRYRDVQAEYVGLFQHLTGEIRDLRLLRPRVVGDGLGTGALVGYIERSGIIGCHAVNAAVSGDYGTGGLAGRTDGSILMSSSTGRIAGIRYVGGLVGHISKGTVAKCYSKAEVVGNESVGGLAGATTNEAAIVDSCYATGPVDGAVYVGGLVGQVSSGRVFRCFSAGKVSGDQYAGGLVGYQRALANVTGSLWDIEASGQTTSVGGTGKTTAEMKSIDTYLDTNFDFFTTWAICDGINYPVLLWQIPQGDLACPDGVDFVDFVWFAMNWRHRDCGALNYACDGADLDDSGDVGFRDLAVFAETWLNGVD